MYKVNHKIWGGARIRGILFLMDNDNDKGWHASIRVPRQWWTAWGRVCGRLGVTRTQRIMAAMISDIGQYGDDQDRADVAAGQAMLDAAAARKRLGRPPTPRPRAELADEFTGVLERAMGYARDHYPQASPQHRAAFANSVAYLCTGTSGGYGGPSVREHAATRAYAHRMPMSEAEAIYELADPDGVIFGPIGDVHRACWRDEHCHSDDPADVAELGGVR